MKLIFASFHVVLFSPEVIPREVFFYQLLTNFLIREIHFYCLSPETIKLKFLNKEIRNKLRLLHFPINNTKTLRNHQSFYDRGVLKKIWKIYSTMGDVFAKMDIEVKFLQSLKHGKILICSQKKCYKKVII